MYAGLHADTEKRKEKAMRNDVNENVHYLVQM